MKFRNDINALRAIAVIAVVLYHFQLPFARGGFVGVDIFFVISGYLMTGIIASDLKLDKFSFVSFYLARSRRIVPALSFASICVVTLCWFTTPPSEYRTISKHALSALTFVSNIIFFFEHGYFDASSKEKFFLHTWSLSVEWQFYILFPVIMFLSMRLSKNKNKSLPCIVVALALSLAFSMSSASDGAYYLLSTRGWELLAGGLVWHLEKSKKNKDSDIAFISLGFILVFGSVFLCNDRMHWPGYAAMLPVIGTCLVIYAQCNDISVFKNNIIKNTGNWSYSIYLWHWIVVVIAFGIDHKMRTRYAVVGVPLSVLLGWLSFQYIENTSRIYLSRVSALKQAIYISAFIAIPSSVYAFLSSDDGSWIRFKTSDNYKIARKIDTYSNFDTGKYRAGECLLTDTQNNDNFSSSCVDSLWEPNRSQRIFVWGDSHAAHLWPGLSKFSSVSFAQYTASSCPPMDNVGGGRCLEIYTAILDKIRILSPDIIVLSGSWTSYSGEEITRGLKRTVENIRDIYPELPIILVGPAPRWKKNLPPLLSFRLVTGDFLAFDNREVDPRSKERDVQLSSLAADIGVNYVSAFKLFCKDGDCAVTVGETLEHSAPIVWDVSHMTTEASGVVADAIMQNISERLSPAEKRATVQN